jgi:uncharacterized protein (DUF2336 family)
MLMAICIYCDEWHLTMSQTKSVLRDLEEAIARGTAESRARALWHTTDLLIAGHYCEEDVATFGEVIERLADEIEIAARAQLAQRMARVDNAPINVIHKLAFDDEIDVAGPVLRESARLDDAMLVANASTKSQAHLLAISQRRSIAEDVTDVLVQRGNREVVNSVARNEGARFSGAGFLHMVKRAEGDSILSEHLGLRKDIPRQLFQQLIAKASDDVKNRLARERPGMFGQIQDSVTDVAGDLQSKFGPVSKSYFVAKRVVSIQHRMGNLNEKSVSEYARSHKIDEVTIGLSLLCAVPPDMIERALFDRNRETLLILAKSLGFSWDTTMSLLFLGAKDHRITAGDLQQLSAEYDYLNPGTSKIVLDFYQSRKNSGQAKGGIEKGGMERDPAVQTH